MQPSVDFPAVAVVFFCHDGKGNLLMAKRSEQARDEQGRWDVGGGRVETHDGVVETVRKEVREEYSTEALAIDFLGFRDVHRELHGVKTHWIALDFKVLVDPAQTKIGEPHKFTDLGWFTRNTLPADLHSQLPIAFAEYGDRLC